MEKNDPKKINRNDELINLSDKRKSTHMLFDIVEEFKKNGQTIEIPPKTFLMRQGDTNDSIYFLLEGQLSIVIDGEEVAQLKRTNDIIGEMSIIKEETCSADVISSTQARLLKIPVSEIKKLGTETEILFLYVLCITLSDKINITNIKAKKFEILNRSLEEEVRKRTAEVMEKNSEILLGYNKLEYMHSETMGIIREFTRLGEKYISTTLKELKNDQPDLEIIKNNFQQLHKSITSLQTLKNEEDKMQGQNVLVLETNSRHRNMIRMALGGTSVQTTLVSDIESAKNSLNEMKFRIVFLAAEFLEDASSLSNLAPEAKFVLLTQNETEEYLRKIQNYSFISNIISLKEEDRAFNVKSISLTVKKIISGDIFGFEKYLNWGVESKQYEVQNSSDRMDINQKIMDSLKELGIRDSISSRCSMVIEELLMNAIYDAPVDSNGKALHNHKQRAEEVCLKPEQAAKIKFASDGILLAISVEDPFGAFKKETILKYLEHNYSGSTESLSIAHGKGGAGKGIFLIIESSDLVIFNVGKGYKTEVIALFELGPTAGKKNSSLHYFES